MAESRSLSYMHLSPPVLFESGGHVKGEEFVFPFLHLLTIGHGHVWHMDTKQMTQRQTRSHAHRGTSAKMESLGSGLSGEKVKCLVCLFFHQTCGMLNKRFVMSVCVSERETERVRVCLKILKFRGGHISGCKILRCDSFVK